jgi:perosamine synthetase
MACFSFYANKVITTGEGGMVVTDDDQLARRLRLLRNLGFATPRFRHEVAGYNFRLTGYQAAMGLAQLRKIEAIIEQKRRVAQTYHDSLKDVAGLRLPVELDWARNVFWMYALVITPEFGMSRDQLADALAARGIETRTFFCPMNQQPCLLERADFTPTPCPVADELWSSGLYLPSSHALGEPEIRYIAEAIKQTATAA